MSNRKYLKKQCMILVSGKAGVGKTTLSKYLVKELRDLGYKALGNSFAGGVKIIAKAMGWDGNKDEKGRKALQTIGKLGRELDQDVWVKASLEKLAYEVIQPDFVVYDDWRFPNEASYLVRDGKYQVVRIRIENPDLEILKGTKEYEDCSETSLPSAYELTQSNEPSENREFDILPYDAVLFNEKQDNTSDLDAHMSEKAKQLINIIFEDLDFFEKGE